MICRKDIVINCFGFHSIFGSIIYMTNLLLLDNKFSAESETFDWKQ